MSYILEAIRRSDEERRRRLVPSVSTVHVETPRVSAFGARSAVAGVAIVAVLTGLAVGIGSRWWPWASLPQQPLALAEPEVAPASPAEVPAEKPQPVSESGVTGTLAAAENQAAADGPADASPSPLPRPADVPAPPVQPPAPDARVAASPPPPPPASVAERPEARAEKTASTVRHPRTPYAPVASAPPAGQPTALGPRVQSPSAASPGPDVGALAGRPELAPSPSAEMVSAMAVGDLPDPVRRSLPDIAISLHRYAESPEARMIRVNGRVGREGEVVGEDLTIAEITRTGVVFAIGDERFYMDAFQNWQARGGS